MNIKQTRLIQRKATKFIFQKNYFDMSDFEELFGQIILKFSQTPFDGLVLRNHYLNARLWMLEDKARDTEALDSDIAMVKRGIDKCNQLRNDQIEIINNTINKILPPMNTSTPLFSETPGSIIDRRSIMELKYFNMNKQSLRIDQGQAHVKDCQQKAKQIAQQISDLDDAFDYEIEMISKGKMHFKNYSQFKTYNDKKFNAFIK